MDSIATASECVESIVYINDTRFPRRIFILMNYIVIVYQFVAIKQTIIAIDFNSSELQAGGDMD